MGGASVYLYGAAAIALTMGLASGASAAAADTTSTLEEVVVTAQLRTEKLQEVPISAQVVSGQTIVEENRNTLDELTQTTPGVHVGGAGDFANSLYIRGIGSSGNPSFDQSVATFIDDIYSGRSRASGATFLDLDRVEILKGPQTTYFGNNAIAGALNIITKTPGDTFDASARALYGSYGTYAVEGETTLPLGDKFSVRLAGIVDGGSGWIHNVNTGRDAPSSGDMAGRVTFAYRPDNHFDVTLKLETSRNRIGGTDQGTPEQYADCPAPAPIGANAGGVFCAQALALGIPIGIGQNDNSGLPGQMSLLHTAAGVLTANYRTDGGLTFTSVTGYTTYDFLSRGDQVNFPVFMNTHSTWETYGQFSQELRVTSPADQKIEYLAGAYVQVDRLAQNFELNVPFVNALGPVLGVPAQDLPLAWNPGFKQHEDVYALFGSATWNVTSSFKVTGGLRGTIVEKRFFGYNQYGTSSELYGGFTPIPLSIQEKWSAVEGAPGSIALSQTERAIMPSVKAQYQLSPEAMVYASYSRGFKSGGFNGAEPFNSPGNLTYGPEHVNAYEVGLKSRLFDSKVLLDVALFRSDYNDLQATASIFEADLNAFTTVVRNAAASRSQGVEFEAQWAPTRNFRLSANVTYLDSKYVSYPNASPGPLQIYCSTAAHYVLPYCSQWPAPTPGVKPGSLVNNVPTFANDAGVQTAFAPRWSGLVSARYTAHLPRDYRLIGEVSPYFSSSYNQQDAPYVLGTAAYVRVDARLTLEPPEGRWAIDLIGKNLTNQNINTSNFGIYVVQKEEPLNVAVQFRVHW